MKKTICFSKSVARRAWSAVVFFSLAAVALQAQPLTIYSGRSNALVDPLVRKFQEETGIEAVVRYGGSAQLALALRQEGARTRADLFWAQDSGALSAVVRNGLFAELPEALLDGLDNAYRNSSGTWLGTSARARVLAYAPDRVDEADLPEGLEALAAERWRGRVGWAPTNGSFQAFVTALRSLRGEEATADWLRDMKDNRAQSYPNNSSLVQALAAGEIDLALTNHYYLLRFKQRDPRFPVAQTAFAAGDPGNLLIVSGIGILESSERNADARRFIEFLLSETAQQYFVEETFEIPVRPVGTGGVDHEWNAEAAAARGPEVGRDALEDLEGTLRILRRLDLL